MRLAIIRHADPDYPNHTITPAGRLEARALAERLRRCPPDRLYSSPLERARHTAQATADALGKPVSIESWTTEIGELQLDAPPCQGFCAWDLHGEVIRRATPLPSHDTWHELPPLAAPRFRERFDRIRKDSDAFLARHGYERDGGVYRVRRPNRETIAVFCHGGFGLTWLAHLLEIPLSLMWAGFFLPPSSVSTVLFDERTPGIAVPRCLAVGDTSHLYAAGLPIQPSGIKANLD